MLVFIHEFFQMAIGHLKVGMRIETGDEDCVCMDLFC